LLFLDLDAGGYLYVIDMGYQRLRLLDQENGSLVREYLFAEEEVEIGSVYVDNGKLYLAGRDAIYVYPPDPVALPMPEPATTPTIALSSLPPHDPAILELLPPLTLPIDGTMLSDMAFRLPGAPRSYRYGVHEGLDFYWAAGGAVTSDTPVLAVADGEIIRADREYVAPSAAEMEEMLAYALEVHHTPAGILDVLRGRQVWIDHGEGVVSRYCHLSAVADGLEVGQRVEQGQIVGYVGNSGTPASYYEQGAEMHLHLEIRIVAGYLGQYLRPIEVKRWLTQVFGEET
jgi:murein DD-endopeptidase MepM/ murein hydrolase activator NlpD